ncbi:MAG TPA: hypothetical protein VGC02_04900 [Methanobacterium sp.]
MPEIPQLYRTKEIQLGKETVSIKGHRGGDYPLLKQLSKIEGEALKLTVQLNRVTSVKDDDGNLVNKSDLDLNDEELDKLIEIKEEIDDLQNETKPIIRKLAQRGVKRFYYPDKKTEEIDKIDDIELNDGDVLVIHQAMETMDKPLAPEEVGDVGGKSKKKK